MPVITEKKRSKNWSGVSRGVFGPDHTFPFDEGFPPDSRGKNYLIVLRDGNQHVAWVDDSEAHRADGISWRSKSGKSWEKSIVAGWSEI